MISSKYDQKYSPFTGILVKDCSIAGSGESSRTAIAHFMRKPNSGVACGLVVGGLREAVLTQPGRHTVFVNARKGFVREAIKHG